jgi:hypothetical protein
MTHPSQPTEPFAALEDSSTRSRVVRYAGRLPWPATTATWWPTTPERWSSSPTASTSRLFDDDLTGRSPKALVDALLDELRRLADRHERGFMVEQVIKLVATS